LSKLKYKDIKFQGKSLETIERVNSIVTEYQGLYQNLTVDNSLVGTAGMLRKINVYKATDGTEKLAMGAGNTKSIEVGYGGWKRPISGA